MHPLWYYSCCSWKTITWICIICLEYWLCGGYVFNRISSKTLDQTHTGYGSTQLFSKTQDLRSLFHARRNDIIKYWNIFHGKSVISPREVFFIQPATGRTWGHQFEIASVRTQLEVCRHFFSINQKNRRVELSSSWLGGYSISSFIQNKSY